MHVSRPDDHFNLEVMETYFCMSSCLEGKVSAVMIAKSCEVISCSIQSQHDMFLFLSVIRSPRNCQKVAPTGPIIHNAGYRILTLMTVGGQWQLETVNLSISDIPVD